jgi:tripartite-type tricarboxylate transporter receptor subunit TctC
MKAISIWWGMFAPAGTPRAIVNKLNAEVGAIMREPETVKWFTALAADPWPSTPEDFARFLAADIARWRKVAKEAGISVQ